MARNPKQKHQLTFNEVLSAAIDDILANGYDSSVRLERWLSQLKEAAEREMTPQFEMEGKMRGALETIYRRMVERGGVLRYNPGVAQYTLTNVKPKLRAELDRRILASASLIKLNREQAIAKTLQRFSGWTTSIPAGGSDAVSKAEIKKQAKKAMGSLPFEERRVIIDQGHKLSAAISEIVAKDGGAIAGRWVSNYQQVGYNYREEHKERHGNIYLIRDSWAHKSGLVKVGKAGFSDRITQPAEEIFCRCYYAYLYHLQQLPEDMLTKKGKDAMLGTSNNTRSDSAESIGYQEDRMNYFLWIKKGICLSSKPNGHWHAQYDSDEDKIVIYPKFFDETEAEQLHIFMHEIGHRGQDIDHATYEEFKKRHLNKMSSFLSMANCVHLEEFERTGKIDSVASEVFAESYARAMLSLPMPEELSAFWDEVLTKKGGGIGIK